MEWIKGMNAAVNYMEEHILEDPDLEILGKLAGCSPAHFQRIFTYIGGVTLNEYLRRRRMSLAAVDLTDADTKVIDVALKYGYDSPTAFNRAFQSVHGITPSAAKENGAKIKAFPPIAFHMVVKGVQEMNYRIEKKDKIRVIGKSTKLSQDTAENFTICPQFWAEVSMDGTVGKLASMMDTQPMGLMGISTCNHTEDGKYYIAVASTLDAPEQFEEYANIFFFILSSDEESHKERFVKRAVQIHRGGKQLDFFRENRIIHDHLLKQAESHDASVIKAEEIPKTLDKILSVIYFQNNCGI